MVNLKQRRVSKIEFLKNWATQSISVELGGLHDHLMKKNKNVSNFNYRCVSLW